MKERRSTPGRRGYRDRASIGDKTTGELDLDFQVNDETYFASLGEEEWEVFVSTPTGARPIPVYDDGVDFGDSPVVVEDRRRGKIIN